MARGLIPKSNNFEISTTIRAKSRPRERESSLKTGRETSMGTTARNSIFEQFINPNKNLGSKRKQSELPTLGITKFDNQNLETT